MTGKRRPKLSQDQKEAIRLLLRNHWTLEKISSALGIALEALNNAPIHNE